MNGNKILNVSVLVVNLALCINLLFTKLGSE